MSKPAVRVDGLWKEYLVGGAETLHGTFYDLLSGALKAPLRRLRRLRGSAAQAERFWALRDLCFEVEQGEVLGIIGHNGAGKSTLLKVLSRITAPTRGRVEVRGRLGSLLEVGTGFHPELTGRENIYLNGAILGMSRREIACKFDEIVEFADVEKFIDTPVKRYSSGMYVRLAFAVAAHLDADVLLVDEVLAVGDAEFQRKCLGKMQDVSGLGRTVLFVSHNMGIVNALCNRCVALRAGEIERVGNTRDIVSLYLERTPGGDRYVSHGSDRSPVHISRIQVERNEADDGVYVIGIDVASVTDLYASLDLRLTDSLGNPVGFGSLGALDSTELLKIAQGVTHILLELNLSSIANGQYRLSFDLTNPGFGYYDKVEAQIVVEIDRLPKSGGIRILDQRWGKGCVALGIRCLRYDVTTKGQNENP